MNQPQQQYPFNFYLDRHVEDIPDFQPEHPTPFEDIDSGIGAQGWTFSEFLNNWQNNNYQEDLWWKYDRWNRVICFGSEGRKLFLGMAEIVISFHENGKFSGNLFQRVRVLPDLNVTHESSPIDNIEAFENGGQKNDIDHFRWMVAAVVRTAFPNDYHDRVSFHFRLFFSEIFTVPEGFRNYFVSQMYHPIFYNSSDRIHLISMMRKLYDLNPHVFTSRFTLEFYGFRNWWSRIRVGEGNCAFYNTLHHAGNYVKLYSNHLNGCTLPHYIRNVQEHLLENGGSNHEITDLELNNLFLGAYAAFIDSAIRNFHGYWYLFDTTLPRLQRTSPNGWCFPPYRFRN